MLRPRSSSGIARLLLGRVDHRRFKAAIAHRGRIAAALSRSPIRSEGFSTILFDVDPQFGRCRVVRYLPPTTPGVCLLRRLARKSRDGFTASYVRQTDGRLACDLSDQRTFAQTSNVEKMFDRLAYRC